MEKLLQKSIAVDLFMLQLIAIDDENDTKFRLPKILQSLYVEVCESVDAKATFLDDDDNNFFQLVFADSDEQDKVWTRLYEFSHSGDRTYPTPNVYDQSNGELLTSKLNEFVDSAITELKAPSLQSLFLFSFLNDSLQLDGPTLNQHFKSAIGTGVKYVMLWDHESNLPTAVMIQGERDIQALAKEFDKVIYKLTNDDWKSSFEFWGEDGPFLTGVHIEIASKFGFEDLEFWNKVSAKMTLI